MARLVLADRNKTLCQIITLYKRSEQKGISECSGFFTLFNSLHLWAHRPSKWSLKSDSPFLIMRCIGLNLLLKKFVYKRCTVYKTQGLSEIFSMALSALPVLCPLGHFFLHLSFLDLKLHIILVSLYLCLILHYLWLRAIDDFQDFEFMRKYWAEIQRLGVHET